MTWHSTDRMSYEPRADQPSPVTQYSPDGRWYWDGWQWVSVTLPMPKWARPYVAPDGLATATAISLGAAAIAEGWIMLADSLYLTATFLPLGSTMASRLIEVGSVFDLALFLLLPSFVGGAISVLAWMYCAYSNLPVLGARRFRWSPGWAVGGWFVPIANLFIPYQTLRDLWSSADERPSLPLYWWVVWIIGNVFAAATVLVGKTTSVGLVVAILSDFLPVVAGILLIVIIQRITRRQRARYAQLTGG